jgi:hypothetical protein
MKDFIEWCITACAIMGFVNFAFLLIIDNKVSEIKREISKLKKKKGGEG